MNTQCWFPLGILLLSAYRWTVHSTWAQEMLELLLSAICLEAKCRLRQWTQQTKSLVLCSGCYTETWTMNQRINEPPLSAASISFPSKRSDVPLAHDLWPCAVCPWEGKNVQASYPHPFVELGLSLSQPHTSEPKGAIRQGSCLQSHLFLKLLATSWEQGAKDEHFLLPSLISPSILFSYQNLVWLIKLWLKNRQKQGLG